VVVVMVAGTGTGGDAGAADGYCNVPWFFSCP
jgi:hypothetical protein